MSRFKTLLRDPLTHFLVAGGVLFALANLISPPPADDRRILVDRDALLEFIQLRSKAFAPGAAAAILDSMTAQQRAALIDDFVREEVLYREAKSLGLDAGDYVIRQRIVQKFEFAADAAIADADPDDAEIAAYYAAHQNDYAIDASASFTHVFFDAKRAAEEADARRMAEELNRRNAPFEAAAGRGDRFPFHVNYLRRSRAEIIAQFGEEATNAIFDDAAPRGVWRAPITSKYGAHVIFVRSVEPARIPPLSEIRDKVVEDLVAAQRIAAREAIIAGAIERYEIVHDAGSAKTTLAGR